MDLLTSLYLSFPSMTFNGTYFVVTDYLLNYKFSEVIKITIISESSSSVEA